MMNLKKIELADVALNGAIHALNEEDYDDKFVHFTHSLREILELVAKNPVGGNGIKKFNRRERGQRIVENIKKIRRNNWKSNAQSIEQLKIRLDGKIYYEQDIIKKLNKTYEKLSKYAHHHRYEELDQKQAEEILREIIEELYELFVPITDYH